MSLSSVVIHRQLLFYDLIVLSFYRYVPPVQINETMVTPSFLRRSLITAADIVISLGSEQRAGAIGTVMTDGKKLKKGDTVTGTIGWTEYASVKESALQKVT